MLDVELWVVVDENGDYECHNGGAEEAMERFADEIGGHEVRRCIKVSLKVPVPKVTVLSGTVPEEACEGAELVAE